MGGELDEEKLPVLLNLKYHAIADAEGVLGGNTGLRGALSRQRHGQTSYPIGGPNKFE
jgi:hypothetical protein